MSKTANRRRRGPGLEDKRPGRGLSVVKEHAMHGTIPRDVFAPATGGVVNLPDLIAIFPLPRVVMLPGEVLPLHIFEPRYRAMVRDALKSNRIIGMVETATDGTSPSGDHSGVRDIGCAGFIADHKELPDGRFLLWLLGLERFTIDEEIAVDTSYRQVRVTYNPIRDSAESLAGLHPVRAELRDAIPRLVALDDDDRQTLLGQLTEISDSQLIALACQILELPSDLKRRLLEADHQIDRFLLVVAELYRHLEAHPEIGGGDTATLN